MSEPRHISELLIELLPEILPKKEEDEKKLPEPKIIKEEELDG